MVHEYKIESIVHSGTKGERGVPVTDDKYDYLVDSVCFFDPDDIKMNYGLKIYLKCHPYHQTWIVSRIQSVTKNDEYLIIETINSIYTFKDCGEFMLVRNSITPNLLFLKGGQFA